MPSCSVVDSASATAAMLTIVSLLCRVSTLTIYLPFTHLLHKKAVANQRWRYNQSPQSMWFKGRRYAAIPASA